jgi:hypothetical protein
MGACICLGCHWAPAQALVCNFAPLFSMKTPLFLAPVIVATVIAQDFAPDSVGNMIVETRPIASRTSIAASLLLARDGVGYSVVADDGPVERHFSHTWVRAGQSAGTLSISNGIRTDTVSVVFTSPLVGTYRDSLADGTVRFRPLIFSALPADVPLRNTPARVFLAPGQPAQVGFTVADTVPRRVLIRAVGPTLAQVGVVGPVASPQLNVFTDRTQFASYNASGGSASLLSLFGLAGAFALLVAGRDCALALALEPGSYNAQVQASTAGEVLLEVYFPRSLESPTFPYYP